MKACLLILLLALVRASEDIDANEIKRRMKLIGGIPSYGVQNVASKTMVKSGENEVEYTDPKLVLEYNASSLINPKGMGHLYTVTRIFMNFIQPKSSYPDSLIVNNGEGWTIGNVKEDWLEWLQHYLGVSVVIAVGLAFAIFMPLVGLFFCCCQCGGKCGARSKHEKQHDSCRRTTLAILVGCLAVIILFGVVCAFVTNKHVKEGLEQLPENITTNLKDTELYLENTEKEVDHLLIINFQQLQDHLMGRLDDAGDIVKDQLAEVSHAVALTNLTNIVSGMEVIKKDLADIQHATARLQDLALTLSDDLDVTREELLKELYNCRNIPACRELLNHHHVAELKVVENFNGLPNVRHTFETISRLLGDKDSIDSIQRKVLEGQRNFNSIKYEISASVDDVKPDFQMAFEKTGRELAYTSDKIKLSLDRVRHLIKQLTSTFMTDATNATKQYADYRYYIGLGISGVLLLILLCITFGLLCGMCGKRPEEMYSDDSDCCNTFSGSRFLILSVWLMFLFSSILMLITLAHFLLGMAMDIALCQPLKNPSNNKIFGLVDNFVNLSSINQGEKDDLKISEVIMAFHRNETIYNAFKLENLVDIDRVKDYIKDFELQQRISQFKNKIKVRTDRLELLTPDAKAKLRDLSDSPLNDIDFDKYAQLLNIQITNINLTYLSQELLINAEKIPDQASSGFDLTKVKKLLRTKARILELLQKNSVAQIKSEILILKANVTTLKEHLKFNRTSLKDALHNLLEEVERAQLYLWKNGTAELKSLLDDFVNEVQETVKRYLDRVVSKTKKEIGKSGPLSNAYNATFVAGCNRVMLPFDGFWMSVGWSILVFIPLIILCVKLAKLYSKSEAYVPPGVYGESEYLYDAYADRDNMPLAMAQRIEKKKKNHHKNYQESYENANNGAYSRDYSAHLGRSDRASASNDARYNDMAPKHWGDYDSRGASAPPRYPSATEYERPPPYYYPGPERP